MFQELFFGVTAEVKEEITSFISGYIVAFVQPRLP